MVRGMIGVRRGTVGFRFTLLYAGVFLASGIGLLVLAFLLSGGTVSSTAPVNAPPAEGDLAATQERIRALENQLAEVHTQQSRQLLFGSLLALIVMAGVSLLFGYVLARRVLRPLRLITAATRRITADDLDQRLAVTGPTDEVKDLADTIDGLLQRLEASFAAQRRFVANASHELRTPLATIRASLDVAVAKPKPAAQAVALAERLRDQVDQVDHLLDGFLVLARAQHGVLSDPVPVDCADLVSEALTARAADIAARQLTVEEDPRSDTRVHGNPALLSRMVENVVDNAVLHNERRGWIRVATSCDSRDVRLVVETGGPVLDQGEIDRLAQPFERLGIDRTGSGEGSGLGLSIVAAIAAAHGGRLDLRARPDGGLRVAIVLPSVPATAGGHGRDRGQGRMRVLVVEDAPALAEVVAEGLRDQGMAVDVAYDGLAAAAKLDLDAYEVVVLDRDLPGIHGDTLCQMITEREHRPMVLMLTAAGSPDDRVAGLTVGADDYLPKPFHFPELILRVHALARRKPAARSRTLCAAGIELDPIRRTVVRDGRRLDLSVKEFALLETLLRASPGFLSTEALLEQVWDENADPFTNTVTVTIGRLRRKLGDPPVIVTTPGVGYRIG